MSLILMIGCSYYFAATYTGRRAFEDLGTGLVALLQTSSKPERIYSPAVGFIGSLWYRQVSALLWSMTFVLFYLIYGFAKVAYSDPHPLARLLLVSVGGLVVYVVMGNIVTMKEIKDSDFYKTQRMFDDF